MVFEPAQFARWYNRVHPALYKWPAQNKWSVSPCGFYDNEFWHCPLPALIYTCLWCK